MTIYNREDYRTVLPQMEKKFTERCDELNDRMDDMQEIETITPTANLCSKGTCTCCYKVGRVVFLSFNINITTAAIATAYLKNLPVPLHESACSGVKAGSATRFRISNSGELVSEDTPSTGWYNGSVVYIAKE